MPNQRKRLGRSLEKRVAERAVEAGLKAHLQPLSGQLKEFPGDVVVENVLIECKVRSVLLNGRGERIISIDLNWLEKALEESKQVDGVNGAVVVIRPKNSARLYVLCYWDFIEKLMKKTF